MQSHLGSVVLCLISTCMVGFKVLRNFYANCGESVQPLHSVKLIDQPCSRSRAAWTLTWLIELKDGFNIAFRLFLWPCWAPSISVLILAYAVQRRISEWSTSPTTRSSEDAITQSEACGRWRWSRVFIVIVVRVKTFVSTLVSVIKVHKPFLYVLSNVLWYYTHESIICVKLWSWHTYEMHSVFYGKSGVTICGSKKSFIP
jgi:hypothetical protein